MLVPSTLRCVPSLSVLIASLPHRLFTSFSLLLAFILILISMVPCYGRSHCAFFMYVLLHCICLSSALIAMVCIFHHVLDGNRGWRQRCTVKRNNIWYTIFINGCCTCQHFDHSKWPNFGDINLLYESAPILSVALVFIGGRSIYTDCRAYNVCLAPEIFS